MNRKWSTVFWCTSTVLLAVLASPVAAGPQDWASTDIGAVVLGGNAAESNGTWTIEGAGSDIWGAADAFHFVYRQTSVPMTRLTARVADLDNTNPYAKSGIMFRSSLDPSAATAILDVKPNGEIEFMEREIDGQQMFYVSGTFTTMPVWLRLDFTGAPRDPTIEPFVSEDGKNWTSLALGGHTIGFPSTYYVGVAVTSHDDQQLTASHVDGLSLAPYFWTNTDIGATGLTGNTVVEDANGQSFTIQGAGADIWGSADAFQFLYQDTQVVTNVEARVVNGQNTNPFAKIGVMLRDGLAPDAVFVILDMKPNGELEFMQRDASGGAVTYLGGAAPGFSWIRLYRNVSAVTAYASTDGTTWTQVGTTPVTLLNVALGGVVVTSHDTSRVDTASVDNVRVVNSEP
jgi:hypothetical protein